MNSIEEHKKMQYCVCRKHCLKANKTTAAFLLIVKLGRIFLKSCKTYQTWWIPTTPAAFRACQGLCTSLSEQACVQIFHIRVSINCMSVYALETSVLAVPLMPGWLVPVKSGADINRPGCSHVSVYTGRPQSSTTRVLDSLAHYSSLSHTETITHKHTHTVHRHGGTVYMRQSGNSPTHMLLKRCCCCISFPLRLSLRPFSYCKHSTQSHQTNADLSCATLLQTLLKAL